MNIRHTERDGMSTLASACRLRLLCLLTLLVATVFGSRAATIGFEDYEIAPGETKTLTLSVTNGAISFIGLQSDIETHDDLTVTGIDFAPGFEYKDKYTLTSNLSNPNKATFMIFAKNIKDVPAEVSGPLLVVTVRFAQNAQPQTELILLGNIKVSDENGNKVEDVESEGWTGSMVIPVSSIKVTPSTWSGKVDESITLTAAVEPSNATDKTVTWTSDNTSIATVDATGKVTAMGLGTTTITAKAGAKTATCTVTIVRTPVTSITLSSTSWSGEEGATLELKATVEPTNATDKTVKWSSDKEDVATVSPDGRVTAVKAGTAVITATASDGSGVKAECNVTVTTPKPTDIKVTAITLSSMTWNGVEGESVKLTATVAPENATIKTVNWSSNDASVATVSADGTVTAVKAGTAVITATAADGSGVKAECTVTVKAKVIEVSTITLSASTWSGKVGEFITLTATVEPANATDKTVSWTSNAPAIASVDATGKVTAISVGTATITATAGGKTATCEVTVVPTPVTSITLSSTSWSGEEGATFELKATVNPTNATNKTVNWSSSDASVASVASDGTVTAVKVGTAVITATAADGSGIKAECKVTVTTKVIEVASITLAPSAWSGKVGEFTTLTATVLPDNATNKTVTWTSSNTSVATVDSNGKVTAVAIGTTTITAKSGTKTATCAVSVVATPVTAIKLSSTTWSGVEDDTFKLTATVEPANATNKAIKWSSNKAEVATVAADGTITAVKAGTAVITAEAADNSGVKAECTVTVKAKVIEVSTITLSATTWSGKVGEFTTLTATVLPDNATNKTVTWTSDNTSVATVDSNGKVTAVALGTTTITAKAGTKTATCTVTIVRTPVTSITLSSTSWSGEEGATLELKATVEPTNATDKTVKWSSDKEDVATVSPDGRVTAVKAGTAVITATASDGSGVKAECKVTVTTPKPTDIKVTAIKLSSTTWNGVEDETLKLTATVEPANATNKAINWSSNKAEVATVAADGTVTAVKAGTAVITAAASDGSNVKAECTVTVTAKVIEVSTITLSAATWSGKVGDSTTLTAEVLPDNATNKTVTWTSNAPAIATVDSSGKVTALAVGKATITATAGGKTATCTVTVVPTPVTSITLSNTSWTGVEGETLDLTAAIQPTNATNKAINWSSSDNSVATVSQEGKVTAVKAGTAVITATAADGSNVKAECKVTVSAKVIEVSTITLTPSAWSGKVGESTTLTATVLPAEATDKTVTWTSSNPSVATVDDKGNVSAVAVGTATITAKAGAKTATCTVTVVRTPVTSITLSNTSWTGVEGETLDLTATVQPTNATDKTINWSSSENSIATVSPEGKVTAVKAGTAVITAEAADDSGVKAECTVTVKAKVIEVSTITLSASTWSGKVGESTTLTATVLPDNATDKTVTWTSSNPSVATVDSNGKVTAVAIGTTTITAKAGAKTATCTVTIVRTPVTSITLSSTSWSGEEGATLQLEATVSPEDATNKAVTWSSNNEKVAIVSPEGKVTAVKAGTAVITATAADGSGVKAECNVTVTTPKPTDVKVTAIKLSSTTWSGVEDDTFKLTATVEPANATIKTINWSSSNPAVATVADDGTVTAVKAGTAVITATAADGSNVKSECTVTVKAKVVEVSSITLSAKTWSGKVGESTTLTAEVLPDNATDKTVTWTSNAPAIASVDANGQVTAMAVGTATITAKAGTKTATCTVTVVPTPVTSITLSNTSWTGVEGETLDLTATIQPTNATNKAINWSSSDNSVATVSQEGKVTAVKAGTAVITATAADGSNVKAECKVTVSAKVIEVSTITLTPSAWSGKVGESTSLTATVLPDNATNKTVTWTSNAPTIASVDATGKVTAMAVGTATITATAGGKTATCTVTVVPTPVTSIRLSETEWTGEEGSYFKLAATVTPDNATDKTINWNSSNPAVATVAADGTVTAVKAGTAVITASASDGSGVKAECKVNVTAPVPDEIHATSITLSATEWSGKVEESVRLTATILPENATNKNVNWSSSNSNIATVDAQGNVTAVSVGKATITATTADGTELKATCQVTVLRTPVETITLSEDSWKTTVGKTLQLTATVTPENATNTDVVWTSSDTKVASVDANGKVTARGVGNAVITATAADKSGVKAECKVTVDPVLVSSIDLSEHVWGGTVGETLKLTATVKPDNATNKGIVWATDNAAVATVDSEGNVKAIAVGEANITATAADGSGIQSECHVTVSANIVKASSITLSETEWSGKAGESVQLKATVLPAETTNKGVKWTSSDTKIATVDTKGNVTAVAVGAATITATTADGSGLSATCSVTVLPTPVEGITLSASTWSGSVGATSRLTATVTPDNATNKGIVWTTSNAAVAAVDQDGNVTAIAVGNAVITATAADKSGVKAECKVTVDPVLVSSIDLSEHVWGGTVGESLKLTATVKPDNATNKGVVWTTDNAAVATVDSEGNVKAIGVGEANITATAADGSGVQSECHVTVSANIVKASSISLSEIAWSGKAGESVQLKATVLPAETTNKGVKWTSSDASVATVDAKGNVTALSVGTALITATTADGSDLSASCRVTVIPTPVEAITLSASTWSGTIGSSFKLSATVTPEDATEKGVVWTTGNAAVATVDSEGNVTAVNVGSATITATAADGSGVKAECKVTVRPILVKSIDLSEHVWGGTVGESLKLIATVTPENATNKEIDWSSSEPAVATVDSEGNVKAIAVGEAVITATAHDGSGAHSECHVTVSANIVKATSISLSETEWSGHAGESVQLKATVLPAETTNKGVKWTSSDTSVATVDAKGVVTAVAVGSATITATTADGTALSATCRVTVLPILVQSLYITPQSWSGEEGESFMIEATVLPDDATNQALTFESSDTGVATVDSGGFVVITGEGTCVIVVATTDGSDITAECVITGLSGVATLFPDNEAVMDVYNQNGILLRHACEAEDLKTLQPGIYIIRRDKTVKKIYLRN